MFQPTLCHQLHADADAEERRARACGAIDRVTHAADGVQAARAVGEGALAGQHDPVGRRDRVRVGRYRDRRLDPASFRRHHECARRGGQVAAAIINDRDLYHRPDPRRGVTTRPPPPSPVR
jgi:hypothetical protein